MSNEHEFKQMVINIVQGISCKLDKLLVATGQYPEGTTNISFVTLRGSTLLTYQRNVASFATILMSANDNRLSFSIMNNGLTTVYIGSIVDTSVAIGFPLASGRSYSSDYFKGAIYGITAGASTDIRVIEESI